MLLTNFCDILYRCYLRYANSGNYKKAHQMARQALAVDPNNGDAKAALATYSTSTGNWPRRRGGRRR